MQTPKLQIPVQSPLTRVMTLAQPVQFKAWLAALPLGNVAQTAQELMRALRQLNHLELSPATRHALLMLSRSYVDDLIEPLRTNYGNAPVPLSARNQQVSDLTYQLLGELACGYKILVVNLHASVSAEESVKTALAAAIHHSMEYSARQLMETYTVYAPQPEHLWLELHQLYLLAERQRLLATPVAAPGGVRRDIASTYRRIVLLALANPYHLMQGEAGLLYRDLDQWASACRITAVHKGVNPHGHWYADLDRDMPPQYASMSAALPPSVEGRFFELADLAEKVETRIKEIVDTTRTGSTNQLSFAGRRQRDMYRRLADAWGVRAERLSLRQQRDAGVSVITGLSACHHYLGGGERFRPEETELLLRGGYVKKEEAGGGGLKLSLMDDSQSPWLREEEANRLATGIVKPRTSVFDTLDTRNDKDMWVKVYSSSAHAQMTADTGPSFPLVTCQQRDESRHGLALTYHLHEQNIEVRVGELAGFKRAGDPEHGDWRIGIVRWIRVTPAKRIEFGVRTLADDALPVGTRAVAGTGKGGEYFRGLIVPKLDPLRYPTTLIAPAAIYDIHSVLLVNTGAGLLYIRLTKLLETTNALTRFQFVITDAPPDMPAEPSPDKAARHYTK